MFPNQGPRLCQYIVWKREVVIHNDTQEKPLKSADKIDCRDIIGSKEVGKDDVR